MADDKMEMVDFDVQHVALKDAAAKSIDPCLTAKVIALSDSRVRELVGKKLQAGYVFRGISCLNRITIPENKYVYFDFDCHT